MAERPTSTFGAKTAPVLAQSSGSSIEQFEELRQKRNQLHERRVRREVELANAEREEEQCAKEAAALGVSSIEALRDLIEQKKREDEEALEKLRSDLAQEEARLAEIDQRVAQIEAR
jgi:hypothetical protein